MGGFGAFQVGGFSPAPRWLQALAARRLFGVMLSISGHLRRGGLGGWLRPRDPGGRRTCGPWDLFRLQVPASCPAGEETPQPEARERFEQFLEQAFGPVAQSTRRHSRLL